MTNEHLIKEITRLRAENDYLKKDQSLSPELKEVTVLQKAQIVQELRQSHPLAILLSLANLARSTFYYQLKRLIVEDKYRSTKARIYEIFNQHKHRYGYRRVLYALRQEGLVISHKTVLKLMRCMNLKSKVRRTKFISFKVENDITAKNLLQRDFYAQAPNEKCVTDFTEFNVNRKLLYFTPIMDLYNGEIISFNTSTRCFFNSVEKILYTAAKKLKSNENPILYSDQGWQYRMPRSQDILKKLGLSMSMSRKGNCLDNAPMESFLLF